MAELTHTPTRGMLFFTFQETFIMKKVYSFFIAAFLSVVALAQEAETKSVDININKDEGNWYASPWVWVVGAAVFILLLVALTRGGRRAD